MSSNTRYLVLAYFIASLLTVLLVSRFVMGVMGIFDLEDPLARYIPLSGLIGVVAGGILFGVLYKHERVNNFGQEVMKELSKVTFPTLMETRAGTVVVIVLVLIISSILGLFDYVFSSLTSFIYS